jgi:uroporphyrinogen-III synthase
MTESPCPLTGLRILVGRARHQASSLSSALRDLGAEVLEIPFIEIRKPCSYKPLDRALQNLETYDWLILTSVNGVDAVSKRLNRLHATNSKLAHLKIAAIGPATADAIKEHGAKVHVVPKEYVAESVVKSLRNRVPGKRVLVARAKVARDVIPQELRKLGAHVDVVEAYETIVPQSSRKRLHAALKSKTRRPHLITFTSSSTVRNFIELLKGSAGRGNLKQLDGILFASIGPITSATLRQLGSRVDIEAEQYTVPGLVAAITSAVRGGSAVRRKRRRSAL